MRIYTSGEFDHLIQEGLKSGTIVENSNGIDHVIECQHPLGKGSVRRIQLRDGLLLQVGDIYNPSEEVYGLSFRHSFSQPLTFAFRLAGDRRVLTEGIKEDYYYEKSGESYLFFVPGTKEIEEYPAQTQLKSVRIYMSVELLRQFALYKSKLLPQELNNLVEGKSASIFLYSLGAMNYSMELTLQQILSCSHQDMIERLYLESKVLELIVLQLTQLSHMLEKFPQNGDLESSDINRIYQAKEILICNIQSPPSLLELSRRVGLNDYKLKRGFRQVFNTTVYKYLQSYRMEQAKLLLTQPLLSVANVARDVGYSSQSRFCDAFKKNFGMTPREYKTSQTNSKIRI